MKFPCLNVSSESVAAFLLPAWLPHFSPLDATKVGKEEKFEGEWKFLESESEINFSYLAARPCPLDATQVGLLNRLFSPDVCENFCFIIWYRGCKFHYHD